jgi:hypothetical protein
MERSELRSAVFEVLKRNPHTHFRAVENDVRQRVEAYERRDVLVLNEILWDLLRQGVLAPGKNSLNPDLPFLHVTEYGARCLEEGDILVHDPDRFVERLTQMTAGDAPDVVRESARLALLTLLDDRPSACLILLAHAAERVLGDLVEALIRRGRKDGRGTKRLEAARGVPGRLPDAVKRASLGRALPQELAEEAERQISGLAGLVQRVRAPDGAPQVPEADRDLALAHALLFLDHCRFAYRATRWLEGRSGESS